MSTRSKIQKYISIQEAIYSRSKREIHHPSAKINGKSWSNEHSAKFMQFWQDFHPNIMEEEMTDFADPSTSLSDISYNQKPNTKTKKKTKAPSKRARSKTVPAPTTPKKQSSVFEFSCKLFRDICGSLEFGLFALQNTRNDRKSFESDIFTFWFCIMFNTTHKGKDFLYFRYVCDQMSKKKKTFHKIQITCDIEYAQKNLIINANESVLTKSILIEIFKYVQPTKLLTLYTYDVDIDSDAFDSKYFNMSNIRWVCNYYGLEAIFMCKLFKVLIQFLDCESVETYLENTKSYHQNWKELQDAQKDLNNMQQTKAI
eukprot:175897_1